MHSLSGGTGSGYKSLLATLNDLHSILVHVLMKLHLILLVYQWTVHEYKYVQLTAAENLDKGMFYFRKF